LIFFSNSNYPSLANGNGSSRTRNKSATSGNYDYKPMYEAFERPVNEMTKALSESGQKGLYSSHHSKNYAHVPVASAKSNGNL
jgi:hypothetical protein